VNEERTGKYLQQWNISVVISDTYIPYGSTKSRSYALFIVIIQPVFPEKKEDLKIPKEISEAVKRMKII
jgi:hypothetical protein